MVESISVREKTTVGIVMQVLSNGDAIDLTDVDYVRLDMIDSSGKVYRYSSDDSPVYIVITTPTTGTITFTPPNSTIFLYSRSPYKLYINIFETSSTSYSVPETENVEIKVLREF